MLSRRLHLKSIALLFMVVFGTKSIASGKQSGSEIAQSQGAILECVSPELASLQLGMSKEDLLRSRPAAKSYGRFMEQVLPKVGISEKQEALIEFIDATSTAKLNLNTEKSIASTRNLDPAATIRPLGALIAATYLFEDGKCVSIVAEKRIDVASFVLEQHKIANESIRLFGSEFEYKVLELGPKIVPVVAWKMNKDLLLLTMTSKDLLPTSSKPSIRISLLRVDAFPIIPLSKYDHKKHKALFLPLEKAFSLESP